jgi:hypothetical protein
VGEDEIEPATQYCEAHPHAGSDECFELVNTWMKECLQRKAHFECLNSAARPPKLPTRVLDIGYDLLNPKVSLKLSNETHGRYIALRHCWGVGTSLRLQHHRIYRKTLPV